jgi:hypothetical protein
MPSTPDSLTDSELISAYKAKFDNWPKPVNDGSLTPETPLKSAARSHSIEALYEALREAIKTGQPLDFRRFANESYRSWVESPKAAQSSSEAPVQA